MKCADKRFTRRALTVALAMFTAGATGLAADLAAPRQFIPASDARFRYEGRFDTTNPDQPVVVWQGSRISLDFEGGLLFLRFGSGVGQNFFNVEVDGTNVVVKAGEGSAPWPDLLPSASGRHHLVLFKRSEAPAGQVRFAGVEIAAGAQAWAPPAPDYKMRMEFLGDSIAAGACNEDGAEDQWDDRRTHNNALSYTTLTAAAFHADYRCTAVSGMGIVTGWTDVKAGEIWDRIYPRPASARAGLKAWSPDVLLINLGENDDSYTRAHKQPFPEGFAAGYVALVKAIRAAYPKTQLVLLRGGMFGGAQSAPLREAWEDVVRQVEGDDAVISHFVFTHWSSLHPRVSDDRAMADELIAWLKSQPFMRGFL
jgi:lysophospholipase L1-like esterase